MLNFFLEFNVKYKYKYKPLSLLTTTSVFDSFYEFAIWIADTAGKFATG
jgi:hypothetical protein